MRLSILIATLESRKQQFDKLMSHLEKQGHADEVEILCSRDKGYGLGGAPIGYKRQSLLEASSGDFIVFMDDDDLCTDNYIPMVVEQCKPGIDCIGYKFACYGYATNMRLMESACVSLRYHKWQENIDGFRYVRCPHHLVPVRREHALKVGFDKGSRNGEDAQYSYGLRDNGLLKKEAFIDEFMYTIYHKRNKRLGE